MLGLARATGAARSLSLSAGEQMGSPEVLARATGSGAERACSSKSVIKQGDPADRPLAGAPSLLGLPQRTPLEETETPLLRRYSADGAVGRLSDFSRAPRTSLSEHFGYRGVLGKPATYDHSSKLPLLRA